MTAPRTVRGGGSPRSSRKAPAFVELEGEVNIYTVTELRSRLLSALGTSWRLDVEVSGVSELDGAGMQLLVAADKEARVAGKALRLVRPSAVVQDALALCQATELFSGGIEMGEGARP